MASPVTRRWARTRSPLPNLPPTKRKKQEKVAIFHFTEDGILKIESRCCKKIQFFGVIRELCEEGSDSVNRKGSTIEDIGGRIEILEPSISIDFYIRNNLGVQHSEIGRRLNKDFACDVLGRFALHFDHHNWRFLDTYELVQRPLMIGVQCL